MAFSDIQVSFVELLATIDDRSPEDTVMILRELRDEARDIGQDVAVLAFKASQISDIDLSDDEDEFVYDEC